MNTITFTKAADGDSVATNGTWSASFVRYPYTVGVAWVFAARDGKARFLFGPLTETGILVLLRKKPTDEQIACFLRDCMAGKVSARGLGELQVATT